VGISAATMRRFMEFHWPGNVRELENIVKRIVVLRSESWIPEALADAPPSGRTAAEPAAVPGPAHPGPQLPDEQLGLKEIARRAAAGAEREALRRVLELVRWNRMEASRRLKVNYKTLLQKISEHRLDSDADRNAS
jgi:two-component system response regulator AtoC